MADEHLYKIVEITDGQRGKEFGTYVKLHHIEKDNTRRWPDFLHGKYKAKEVNAVKTAGVGGKVWVSWKSVEKIIDGEKKTYYNIETVRLDADDIPTPAASIPKPGPADDKPDSSIRESATWVNSDALRESVKMTKAMLSADPRFKSLLKTTKTTPELLVQGTLDMAVRFKEFLEGNYTSDIKSDDSDLKDNPVQPEEPDLPKVPADDDDIPF